MCDLFALILSIIKTRMLYTGVGQVSTTFKADSRRNLVSALTKLYPSPDWNVGVDRINLCDGNCTWRRTIVKDLYPWDAGNKEKHIICFALRNNTALLILEKAMLRQSPLAQSSPVTT